MKVLFWKVSKGKIIDESTIQVKLIKFGVPVVMVYCGLNTTVFAATDVNEKMKPIINVLQDLAQPVSYCFMIYGGLKMSSGHMNEGQKIIKNSIGGYVFIQFIPWLFDIIKSIGRQ